MNRKSFNRIFFEDKETYEKLDNETKKEQYFMFNRCMARLVPTNCDALNTKSMDESLAMDVWSIFSKSLLKEPPGFNVEWWKFAKTKNILDGFNKREQEILSAYYNPEIDKVLEGIENEKLFGKIEKKKI